MPEPKEYKTYIVQIDHSRHIDPNKAMDPGLIYDIEFQQYVDFLCSLGYNEAQMKAVLRRSRWDCSRGRNELNYPSFISILSKDERSGKVGGD
ncbi:hypothetical protein V6N13_123337 [Hibiscus sabdariffa]